MNCKTNNLQDVRRILIQTLQELDSKTELTKQELDTYKLKVSITSKIINTVKLELEHKALIARTIKLGSKQFNIDFISK